MCGGWSRDSPLLFWRVMPCARSFSRNHYAVDTSRDITPVLDKVVRAAEH